MIIEMILNVLNVVLKLALMVIILALIFALPILLCIRKRQDRKDQKRIVAKNRAARERLEAKDKIVFPDKQTYKPRRWGRKWVDYINSMKGPRPGSHYSGFPAQPTPPFGKEK